MMLQEEMASAVNYPNFVTLLCTAFEGEGCRRQLKGKEQVEHLLELFSSLKCSPPIIAAILYALTQSRQTELASEARKLLKAALVRIDSHNFHDLPMDAAERIHHFIMVDICTDIQSIPS